MEKTALQIIEKTDLDKYQISELPVLLTENYAKYEMNPEAEAMYLTALLSDSKNYKLAQAVEKNKRSLAIALHAAATFGLSANPYTHHFSLIPYGDKVSLLIEYRGKLHIAKRDFALETYEIGLVIEGEEFEMDFKTGVVKHKRKNFRKVTEQNLLGGFAVGKLKNGQIISLQFNKEDILLCREAATTKNVWNKWFEKMVLKTIVHQLFDEIIKHSNPDSTKLQTLFELNKFEKETTIDVEYKEQIEEQTTLTTPENIAKKETLSPDTEKWDAALEYISEAENTDTAFQKIEKKYEISADDKVRLVAEAVDLFSYKIEQAKNGNGDEYTD